MAVAASSDPQPSRPLPQAERRRGRPPRRAARRYQTGDVVGRGGMGEVVAARDLHLGREIAVKRMLAPEPSERAIYRFLREARIQARLDHPAIVPVYDVGRDSHGRPYFTMKKVNGTTLAELLRAPRGAREAARPRLLRAFVDVCLAIELAHTRGVVHRDVKPENLLLGDFGEVYVLDWGLARIVDEHGELADVGDTACYRTAEGAMIGTPGYMAPEQIRAELDVDGAADVYALGCVLFEILAGEPLHPGGQAGLESALAGADARPSARGADAPPELEELCVRATGDRRRRPSARALGERVQRYLDGDRDATLRQELARQHLARARVAFERGIDRGPGRPGRGDATYARGVAMREAGRALALDPSLTGPAELVGRLMLEPPRRLPDEVCAALEADAAAANRSQAKIALCMSLGYLGFLPGLVGYRGTSLYAAGLALYVVLNALLVLLRARGAGPAILQTPAAVAIRNAILIAALGCFYSPFLVGPGLAVVTAAALLSAPMFQRPRAAAVLVAAMLAAVLLPWLGELAGILPEAVSFQDSGVVIHTPALGAGAAARAAGWVAFTALVLAASTTIVYIVRRTERASRRRLHLQAWHLRQLVP